MPGPTPKPAAQRQRRNKATSAATFEAPAATKVPLPGNQDAYHPLTHQWWESIWESPMAREEWVDSDVHLLFMLATLVNRFWIDPTEKLASEIRQFGGRFGLDPMSRRSLQWEIKRLTEPAKAPPVRTRTPRQRTGSLAVLEGGKAASR